MNLINSKMRQWTVTHVFTFLYFSHILHMFKCNYN